MLDGACSDGVKIPFNDDEMRAGCIYAEREQGDCGSSCSRPNFLILLYKVLRLIPIN